MARRREGGGLPGRRGGEREAAGWQRQHSCCGAGRRHLSEPCRIRPNTEGPSFPTLTRRPDPSPARPPPPFPSPATPAPRAQKVKKLKASLHMIGVEPKERKHVVFVESKAEVKAFSPEEYFQTPAELLGRSFNRPRERQLLDESIPEASGPAASKVLKKAEA